MTPPERVVLLRDGGWPSVPGVCCWREAVHAAFAAAGAQVTDATCLPRVPRARMAAPAAVKLPRQHAATSRPRRAAWIPLPVRHRMVSVYHGYRSTAGALREVPRQVADRLRRPPAPPPRLAGAGLVIAESLAAASVAADSGVPADRLWALALPPERLAPEDPGSTGRALAEIAPHVGGFLVDSELTRESVERVAASCRPRIEIFPPLAVDAPCAGCAQAPAEPPVTAPAEIGLLAGWHALARSGGAGHPAGSLAFTRLRGGDWAPAPRSPWAADAAAAEPSVPAQPGPVDATAGWTTAAQRRAARAVLDAVVPRSPVRPRRARTALLAGYDLKFARDLASRLDRRTDLDLMIDDWPDLGYHTAETADRLRRADAIFAEWARTSAVWLSHRKRADQFLAVRLHRFELDSPYPRQIAMENVDAVVYIAPLFGRRIASELPWPTEKLIYIPNFIDLDWLDRPKLPGARFSLGFVGVEWARKRFDLALDLLAGLRREDLRFHLVVRSVMPWHNEFAWADPAEREYASWCFERIEREPLLRGGVTFDPPGRDMARWYRRVGHIISTSDEEGSHAAVSEGMASGAVPIIRPWPGAAEIYDQEWVFDSTAAAVAATLECASPDHWQGRVERARAEIRRSHDPSAVVDAWADLLHGDVAGARRYFAEYSSVTPAEVGSGDRSHDRLA